jgi:hypothetical protein
MIRWSTWVVVALAALSLWDSGWLLTALFYGIPALGFSVPLVALAATFALQPAADEAARRRATNSAYEWLTGAAVLAALFVLMLSATVLSLLGEAEWQLGLGIVWELLGIPLQAVILMLALRGLALGVRAERHAELRVVALYTSVFFLCAASPSQWPIFVAGDYWPYANLPFVLPYPIVCYFMIRRGLAKLAAGSAPTS